MATNTVEAFLNYFKRDLEKANPEHWVLWENGNYRIVKDMWNMSNPEKPKSLFPTMRALGKVKEALEAFELDNLAAFFADY